QMNLGFAQLELENLSAAETALTRALRLQRDVQARALEGEILRGLALVNQAQDDDDTAIAQLQQSLALHQELGDRPNEAHTLSDLGTVLADQDQPELAIAKT
ncbi:MAG: tetratricopeptide repeat protein, partial [Okeania sp. SIO2H7]|nr:tetratricopeptide repeat protein [Okeania sp. SIO2H7]